jgi:hypothetical protein
MNYRTVTLPLKGAALGLALALCFSAGAQASSSDSAGNIAGRATPGDVVVVSNPDTGFTREITVGENGRYRMILLPTGRYLVTVRHADGTVYIRQSVPVTLGRTTPIK